MSCRTRSPDARNVSAERLAGGFGARRLRLVLTKEVLDLILRERVQLDDLGLGPVWMRHNGSGLIPGIDLHERPSFVLPVLASPIGVSEEVGTGLQEDFDGLSTCHRGRFVWNLDQEPSHQR